jgi:hypothetical protein
LCFIFGRLEQRIVLPPIHPARLLSSQPNSNLYFYLYLDIGLGARRRFDRTALASEMADLGYRSRSAGQGVGLCGPELVGYRCGSVSPSLSLRGDYRQRERKRGVEKLADEMIIDSPSGLE